MSSFRWLIAAALSLMPVVATKAAQVVVFAAASLTDALQEAAADYEPESGDCILFNFAGSGILARQIESGAPADLFVCADEAKVDRLEAGGWLVGATRRSLLSNGLVLVAAADNQTIRAPADLARGDVKLVALGDVKVVPAGAYAKAYLVGAGLWASVESKAVFCESVRAVLAAVESGNADAALVYRTDAAMSGQVRQVLEVPAAESPKISYPIAMVTDAPQAGAAARFLAYLGCPAAGAIFRRHGFVVLGEAKER